MTPAQIASKLTKAQRELLLRYDDVLGEQAVTQAECFDPETSGCVPLDQGEVWIVTKGAHSPAGSVEFSSCWISYTPLGLSVRAAIIAALTARSDGWREGVERQGQHDQSRRANFREVSQP